MQASTQADHHIDLATMAKDKKAEKFVAIASFFAAFILAILSMLISEDHDIAAGVMMQCAQFLTLTGTIFGINYKSSTVKDNEKKD